MATNVHGSYILPTMPPSPKLDDDSRRPAARLESMGRASSSGMSAGSEDTTDSGFYQLNPDNLTPEPRSPSPRPSPGAIRRLSNMTESTDTEDIDFFLKVVSEFRMYVSEKIDELEEQHKMNETQLEKLQTLLKESEDAWTKSEINVTKDVNSLVALLQKQQGIYVEQIKKQRSRETDALREKMDVCRRNMKIISGVVGYARRIANEKDDSIRQQTLNELKQRFTSTSEREVPDITHHFKVRRGIDPRPLSDIRRLLEESLSGRESHTNQLNIPNTLPLSCKAPTISAQSSPDDVTKNSVIVRWTDEDVRDDVRYEVEWKSSSDLQPRRAMSVNDTQCIIDGLNSNCDITVQVRRCSADATSELSAPAFFKTKPQPAKFHLDSDTAHAKLQLSQDLFSVHYPGDTKGNAQKSPSRFTFALNVLGNISFFTGRHYWEVLVNVDGWAVGVAYRNVPRNSWFGSNDSSWILHYNPTKKEYKVMPFLDTHRQIPSFRLLLYFDLVNVKLFRSFVTKYSPEQEARHAGESIDITIKRKKRADQVARVGIFVDYEEGIISFVDCQHMDVLHTYRTDGFTEPIAAAVNPFYHGGVLTMITGLDIPDINLGI